MGEGIKTRRGESKGIVVRYLYKEGDEYTALTGGWANLYTSGSGNVATKNDDNLFINGGVTGVSTFRTTNKINLTDYSIIRFDIETIKSSYASNNFQFIIHSATGKPESSYAAHYDVVNVSKARGVYFLDVTALNSSYYISILSYANHQSWLYAAWLE